MNTIGKGRLRGQALVFILMVLVILFFVVLWNFDLNKILRMKAVTQNAGDAAALAAARWQGVSLNLIGNLNVMHAFALSEGDAVAEEAITNMQARLAYVGPMIALMAAQQAAKNNGIYENPDFTTLMHEHASRVRNDYPAATGPNGEPLFPEPYPGCWQDYADMLEYVADEGVAAGPDNVHYYADVAGGHYLLMRAFYEAVAGRNWCWFYHNAMDLLQNYTSWRDWDPLPEIPHQQYINSEVFGLGLVRQRTSLDSYIDRETMTEIADSQNLVGDITTNAMAESSVWYCYATNVWRAWEILAEDAPERFPIAGTVRPQYDYAGADAAIRIEAGIERLTPASGGSVVSNEIVWSAAAKPFGYLGDDMTPHRYGLVLPAFHTVRLIPVDASSAPFGGGYNLEWRRHIEQHLPVYVDTGQTESSCWYCRQLVQWEDYLFRQSGITWLSQYSYQCTATTGGGGSHRGGGTRRGH